MSAVRVLLVESNPITCSFVCAALAKEGVRVTEAHGGAGALGIWAAEPCDLIVQDLVLSDMDGFEFMRRLRGLPGGADVPVLALSGLLSEPEEAHLCAAGFSDIILKPIEASRLRQAIRAHLPMPASAATRFGVGRRLLIVDDDPIQAKLVFVRLSRLGFEASIASNGLEALQMARLSPPDAIVSDVMMPVLDGFGLCAAIRREAHLATVPLVLMTNSYVEDADRELAQKAGADRFVIRTPNMSEVVEALRSSLSGEPAERSPRRDDVLETEALWQRRVMNQLERQLSINTGMARRCSMLSAELAVLSSTAEALARHDDIHVALTNVLGACADAGGFAIGALYLAEAVGGPEQLLEIGDWQGWTATEIRGLSERALRSLASASGQPLSLSDPAEIAGLSALLAENGLAHVVVAPVVRLGTTLGVLFMGARTRSLHPEDRVAFLEGVAAQIAQALTVAQLFAEKDASERRAREQATLLRSVLDTIGEGVVVADAKGEIQMGNAAAASILGADRVWVPPCHWPDRLQLSFAENTAPLTADRNPLLRALAGAVVDGGEAFQLPDVGAGTAKYVTISARPLEDGGLITGAVAVWRDVTDERSAQAQLLVADRLASVGMLAAGVGHEINNPLAAVVANLELVAEPMEALSRRWPGSPELEDCERLLSDAREAAERVRNIARDLRMFGRGEAEDAGAVDVHDVLESVLRMASVQIRHRAQVVRDYGSVRLVQGNASRLSQVFLNLIVNAAQALPENARGNEIRIRTRMDESGLVAVTVTDTGPGIAPEALSKLFVPFFTTKQVGVGTGLGLSICERLVRASGGRIEVESQLGQGATFRVQLQPADTSSGVPAPAPAQSRQSAVRRARILMVDDEPMILSILSRALASEHDCVPAMTGHDALSKIAAGERFDVIFCDLVMPGMNGMDLYGALRREAPDQADRVVFLTGGAVTSQVQEFLSAVPNSRIEKPFSLAQLQAQVRARLR